MVFTKELTEKAPLITELTVAKKRRLRKKKALTKKNSEKSEILSSYNAKIPDNNLETASKLNCDNICTEEVLSNNSVESKVNNNSDIKGQKPMSSKEPSKSREDVKAAREAKKFAKHKTKSKGTDVKHDDVGNKTNITSTEKDLKIIKTANIKVEVKPIRSKDEVDKALPLANSISIKPEEAPSKSKEDIIAARVTKKEAKKQGAPKEGGDINNVSISKEISNKIVSNTLDKIVQVANDVKEISAKIAAMKVDDLVKKVEPGKSKAELKAERRAKQEAQRAAKSAQTVTKPEKVVFKVPDVQKVKTKDEQKIQKPKQPTDKVVSKSKVQGGQRVNWFQHLYAEREKASLERIGINHANLHPAIVKLGVQLSSRVVSGSNARCIALLNALKQVVKDYTLPAKTEYSRGLEAYLAPCLKFLWTMRKPSSSQTNAIKYFRYQLTQLANNINEFEAKTKLQEAIDTYIREQIDMAGEAISLSVRKKISDGDNILTYGCSSLIERVLTEAWASGVKYRAVVAGARAGGGRAAIEMLRRLVAAGVPATYVDITALSLAMTTVSKVLVGASALLVHGGVVAAGGAALLALAARARNVPVLVCCERHRFSEKVHTDAFMHNEIGDPEELIDTSDENSPLKDWRSNPNLTISNLMYDVIPPSLVTAVVTDLAILPCSSAPVVLRFMLSEYGF